MNLTKTEQEIIELIQLGVEREDLALAMFVSPHTIKTHLHNIYKKCSIERTKENYHNSFKRLQNEVCIR